MERGGFVVVVELQGGGGSGGDTALFVFIGIYTLAVVFFVFCTRTRTYLRTS